MLFFQGEDFAGFAEEISRDNADAIMKVDKAMGIVRPDTVCGKLSIVGVNANEDTYAVRPG